MGKLLCWLGFHSWRLEIRAGHLPQRWVCVRCRHITVPE